MPKQILVVKKEIKKYIKGKTWLKKLQKNDKLYTETHYDYTNINISCETQLKD